MPGTPEWRVVCALVAEDVSLVLDASMVAGLASPRSYERGVLYLEEGRVGALRASAGRVAATVPGSESCVVELTADGLATQRDQTDHRPGVDMGSQPRTTRERCNDCSTASASAQAAAESSPKARAMTATLTPVRARLSASSA